MPSPPHPSHASQPHTTHPDPLLLHLPRISPPLTFFFSFFFLNNPPPPDIPPFPPHAPLPIPNRAGAPDPNHRAEEGGPGEGPGGRARPPGGGGGPTHRPGGGFGEGPPAATARSADPDPRAHRLA